MHPLVTYTHPGPGHLARQQDLRCGLTEFELLGHAMQKRMPAPAPAPGSFHSKDSHEWREHHFRSMAHWSGEAGSHLSVAETGDSVVSVLLLVSRLVGQMIRSTCIQFHVQHKEGIAADPNPWRSDFSVVGKSRTLDIRGTGTGASNLQTPLLEVSSFPQT